MKKSELKKLLKPLVQECIREALIENGILAAVVTEVIQGVQGATVIRESIKPTSAPRQEASDDSERRAKADQARQHLQEQKNKVLESIGTGAYNGVDIFEGTTPLKSAGSPGSAPSPGSALSGVDPSDPGINIDALTESMGNTWKKLAGGK
jgi:hypothetical protein